MWAKSVVVVALTFLKFLSNMHTWYSHFLRMKLMFPRFGPPTHSLALEVFGTERLGCGA